jgi:hypothetical protein
VGLAVLAVCVMGMAVGILPDLAPAQRDENGPRLWVQVGGDGTVPPLKYDQVVTGTNFVAGHPVRVFQCSSAEPVDPRQECMVAGESVTKADGSFEAKVIVSAGMETKNAYCAPVGTSQCYLVAATYDLDKTARTSEAEHHLCFSEDFAEVYTPQQYQPTRQPHEDCEK